MKILHTAFILCLFVTISCAQKPMKPKVTFIELGSVRCIPCQKMQKVIKRLEETYPKEVETIFYDVWTKEGKKYGDIYDIDLIPTQVFLDADGHEYYRHEGYFEFDSVRMILQQKMAVKSLDASK